MTTKPKAKNTLAPAAAAVGAALGTFAGKEGLDSVESGKVLSMPPQKHRLPRKEKKRLRNAALKLGKDHVQPIASEGA